MKKGVLIIAIGSWYGRWASNLAASIRWNSDIPITLAHDGAAVSHFSPNSIALFDQMIHIPPKFYNNGTQDELKAKLFMYDLSPYQETVYIDAENLFLPLRKVDELFRDKFTIQSRSVINASEASKNPQFIHWGNIATICKQFNITSGKLYNLFSEYVYFKKDKKTKKIFDDAKKVWEKLEGSMQVFNGSVPDELCFMVAMNKNKIEQDVFCPTYWETAEERHLRMGAELYNYHIYSMGGNTLTSEMKALYNGNNSLTQMYCNKYGIIPYMAKDKKTISAKRHNK